MFDSLSEEQQTTITTCTPYKRAQDRPKESWNNSDRPVNRKHTHGLSASGTMAALTLMSLLAQDDGPKWSTGRFQSATPDKGTYKTTISFSVCAQAESHVSENKSSTAYPDGHVRPMDPNASLRPDSDEGDIQ